MPTKRSRTDDQLRRSIERLNTTIRNLPEQYTVLFHPRRNLILHFFRGMVYGLGMIVSIAIVIPFAILLLNKIQWVPIIGDFLNNVVSHMELLQAIR